MLGAVAALFALVPLPKGIPTGHVPAGGSTKSAANTGCSPLVATRGGEPAAVASTSSGYDAAGDVGSMYNTTLMTGAQTYWQHGYTGAGIDVAVIDTGVVPVDGLITPGEVCNGPDLSGESTSSGLAHMDAFGHGTYIAGIIAGRDSGTVPGHYAGDSAHFIGMAPDARIISLKVADASGDTDVTQMLAAIDWVIAHHHDPGLNIRVLNLSFATDSVQSYLQDPLAYAAEEAWKAGIVVVGPVGDTGSVTGVEDPAVDPYLIAVGAADTNGGTTYADHTVATFSTAGKGTRNPDLVAPGTHIASLRNRGSLIDTMHPTAVVGGRFSRGSGTEQASAVVSGAAALLISQHPELTPDQVKALLVSTATSLAGQPHGLQGAGELNLRRALGAAPAPAVQDYAPSLGTGSVAGTHGAAASNGVAVRGEVDLNGNPLNASPMPGGAGWQGGTWEPRTWTGAAGWVGGARSGCTWSGGAWSGCSGSGGNWSGGAWSGATWGGDWS